MADHASGDPAASGYRGPTVSTLVGISYRQLAVSYTHLRAHET